MSRSVWLRVIWETNLYLKRILRYFKTFDTCVWDNFAVNRSTFATVKCWNAFIFTVPSKIDINKTSNSSTNESITLKWETPCRPNGIITNYTINITNIDTGEEQLNSTKSNATNETIQGLMPYRNYTISISGNTIAGGGNYSDPLEVTTAVGSKYAALVILYVLHDT